MNSPMRPEDRAIYRRWWEETGRGDLSLCPCGAPAVGLTLPSGRPIFPAGYGLCPRHRIDLSGGTREYFAQGIIDGSFIEADLTDDEDLAELVAAGFLRGGPN